MSHRLALKLISLTAVLCLSACASRGASFAAADSQPSGSDSVRASEPASEPEYGGGIQTRAMRSAPATQQARNDSRPLSELNTPEAIAAREAAARAVPRAPVAVGAKGPASGAGARAVSGSGSSPVKAGALQKGSKVRVRNDAPLYSRPNSGSDKLLAMNVDGEIELGPQVYNADGYWWYVQVGKETGWLLQADILR